MNPGTILSIMPFKKNMKEEQIGLTKDRRKQKSIPAEVINDPADNHGGDRQAIDNDLFENDWYVWSLLLLVNKKEPRDF